ncbi:hypothetical protein GIB67_041794 [Kingdonia uniflora]|uniref:poly(A)-specific ribonuclease n=1 Tax=Kingdonia uniflora TaxID=39325 RepID=A0A7J7L5K8_9MAGN|nr:hypothetical protein GIB67_041794 [Kingdonia uniflora]
MQNWSFSFYFEITVLEISESIEEERKMREIWSSNLTAEMIKMDKAARECRYVSIDTEFPGFLKSSARDADLFKCYEDLEFNVSNLKLIQLGLTFSDVNRLQSRTGDKTWQINFKDFNPSSDIHVSRSIELLTRSGIDFQRNKEEGVDSKLFTEKFNNIIHYNPNLKWITFHGLYDLAYLVKLLNNNQLPTCLDGFLQVLRDTFGELYDVKYMAGFLLRGEIGLERLANILEVKRIGASHQAGSDSLLTNDIFWKIKNQLSNINEDKYQDCLYGTAKEPIFLHFYWAKVNKNHPIFDPTQRSHAYYSTSELPHPVYYEGLLYGPCAFQGNANYNIGNFK